MTDEQKPASWAGKTREEVLAEMNQPRPAPAKGGGVDVLRLLVFIAVVGGAIAAGVAGHFGAFVILLGLLGVVLLIAAAIFKGFVTEVSKIFRR